MSSQTLCIKCGSRVEPDAETCPTCGDQLQPHKMAKQMKSVPLTENPIVDVDQSTTKTSDVPEHAAPTRASPSQIVLLTPDSEKELSTPRFIAILSAVFILGLTVAVGLITRHNKEGVVPSTTERVVLLPKESPLSEMPVETTSNPSYRERSAGETVSEPSHPELQVQYPRQTEEQTRLDQPSVEPQPVAPPAPPQNLIENGDFSKGNYGFRTSLNYVMPSENCLWADGFTIAPVWNAPLLHRLFAPAEYSAPVKVSGNEQVFYANCGGSDLRLVWTATVTCDPQTNYRISFWNISLNGEQEWIPTYQIWVNGSRSSPQRGGFGSFSQVSMSWSSGSDSRAEVSIMRLPRDGNGGLIAISSIEMMKVP